MRAFKLEKQSVYAIALSSSFLLLSCVLACSLHVDPRMEPEPKRARLEKSPDLELDHEI